jgi:hypothetical protein
MICGCVTAPVPTEWLAAYRQEMSELVPGKHSPTFAVAQAELARGLGDVPVKVRQLTGGWPGMRRPQAPPPCRARAENARDPPGAP